MKLKEIYDMLNRIHDDQDIVNFKSDIIYISYNELENGSYKQIISKAVQ